MVSVGKKMFTLHYPGSIADRLAICAGARVKENIEKGNMQSIESFAYSYLGKYHRVTCDMHGNNYE